MNIGSAIRLIRKQKGIKQKDLAARCNLSTNALSQIESDLSFPQQKNIKLICKALDIPVSYLLFSSISEEDIPEHKKTTFYVLSELVKKTLIEL